MTEEQKAYAPERTGNNILLTNQGSQLARKAHIFLVRKLRPVGQGHPAMLVRNVRELIALAKQNSGRITVTSSGAGSSDHLVGEPFQMMSGTRWTQVVKKGGIKVE